MRLKVIGTGPWAAVYRSLLPEPECQEPRLPDAVIVASKAHTHHSEAIRYLRWRVPVLVEKPFAMSVAQCEEMIETAEQFGTYLAAAHVLKFDRRIEEFRRHLTRTNQIVSITWTDPTNGRYDVRVPIENDVLPHIVSIVDTLRPGFEIACDGISYGGRGRSVRLTSGRFTFDCHLERDSDARRRLIETDGATLDFSALPADHNPLVDLIQAFIDNCGLSFPIYEHSRLGLNLALHACRVTEDVLACVERFKPADRKPEEAWI